MYDLIILGASGFTGKHVLEEAVNCLKSGKESFTYAVAGRSERNLEKVLIEVGESTNTDTHQVNLILCDLEDKRSLVDMAKQGKVVLNCVGPYRFQGKNVVEACIEAGTHYVDICSEIEFLESVQKDYHDAALAKGVYVVGSCGFESLPADVGTVYLTQHFGGDVNSVEEYIEYANMGQTTPKIHFGTWASAVHTFANFEKLGPIRIALMSIEPLSPEPFHKLIRKPIIHYNKTLNGWCAALAGSDRTVMIRTQNLLYRLRNLRPVQVDCFEHAKTFCKAMMTLFMSVMFLLVVRMPCRVGQWFLLEFPRLMSFGYVTHEGPNKEEMNNLAFTVFLYGLGWGEKFNNPTDAHADPPNKRKVLKIRGVNPEYGATSVFLIQSAVTILREKNRMPLKGGVYSPGAAFSETGLVDRLQLNGISFEISDVH